MLSLGTREFMGLDDALRKIKPVYDFTIIPETFEEIAGEFFTSIHDLKVYQFGGIEIAKEQHGFYKSWGGHPFPRPRYPDPFSKDDVWVRFYVCKGIELVSDENEIKELIKKATGVELSVLESRDSSVSVVREIDLEEDLDFKARLETQPDDSRIGIQAYNMKRQLETSPDEFNLGNLGYDLSHNKEIIEIIYKLSENFIPRKK